MAKVAKKDEESRKPKARSPSKRPTARCSIFRTARDGLGRAAVARGEIAIAKRIEAGREAMIAGLRKPADLPGIIIWRDELNEGKILLRDIIDLSRPAGPDGKQGQPMTEGSRSAAPSPPETEAQKPPRRVDGDQTPKARPFDDEGRHGEFRVAGDGSRTQARRWSNLRPHRRRLQAAAPNAPAGPNVENKLKNEALTPAQERK